DAQARMIFRDLIDTPATVVTTHDQVQVRFHRRAHLPIVLAGLSQLTSVLGDFPGVGCGKALTWQG
ncbi:MAG: hypothetical protein ABSH33_24830, partial [Steroidobacteraceae bacterium]